MLLQNLQSERQQLVIRETLRSVDTTPNSTIGFTYAGDLGIVDFHSHRVAFITHLCRTADFSTVVDLARHSDPKLTSKIYDRVRLENRVAAINGLPLPTESIPASRQDRR